VLLKCTQTQLQLSAKPLARCSLSLHDRTEVPGSSRTSRSKASPLPPAQRYPIVERILRKSMLSYHVVCHSRLTESQEQRTVNAKHDKGDRFSFASTMPQIKHNADVRA